MMGKLYKRDKTLLRRSCVMVTQLLSLKKSCQCETTLEVRSKSPGDMNREA